jgi:nucleoside-diphosphate-sugar epimerase
MKVLITGANGFIGRNLRVALGERDGFEVLPVTRDTDEATLKAWAGNQKTGGCRNEGSSAWCHWHGWPCHRQLSR